MKRTLTTLLLLLAAASACIDPLPTDPIDEPGIPAAAARHDMIPVPVVYRGQAAINHYADGPKSDAKCSRSTRTRTPSWSAPTRTTASVGSRGTPRYRREWRRSFKTNSCGSWGRTR